MANPFYVTTPIYYVNAQPHLGHAYTTILADVVCRFNRMRGANAFFLTGTDEHGDKIVRAAEKENLSPRQYVDRISAKFRNLWPALKIDHSDFIRTTDEKHIAVVETILQRIYDQGNIYFSEYEGKYCFGCERFYADRELVDGKCPDHETEPETIKESNYFFRMSQYQDWLIDHINTHPDFIRPKHFKNEVLAFLRVPLDDLCISRPKSRLDWGITLPFDENYVTYVWFDALLNYISAMGYPTGERFKTFWPYAQHIVAKDILKPHGIYWPIILKAADIPVYQHLNVHGYWNVDHSKMSKSLGNVVDPLVLKNLYGSDAFRYFLMRDMSFGLDAGFSETALVQRINSDLANDLGNLFSRVLTMVHKFCNGTVPDVGPDVETELKLGLETQAATAISDYETEMDRFAFQNALKAVWVFINQLNKYVDTTAPWELAKKKSTRNQLEIVLHNLLEGLGTVSGLIYPVMPDTAVAMQRHLNIETDEACVGLAAVKSNRLIPPGSKLPKSITLFPRIDLKKLEKGLTESEGIQRAMDIKPEISMDAFSKVDLRVATVIDAEPVPKSKKLLKLAVDLGEKRTVVAGIAEKYKPEELIGKQVVIVANLRPAKLMGVVSNGMVLAATEGKQLALVSLDKETTPGTALS